MNLEKLRQEIERLNGLKENRKECNIDLQLKAIKQTVEAVDNSFEGHKCDSDDCMDMGEIIFVDEEEEWFKIKELLK